MTRLRLAGISGFITTLVSLFLGADPLMAAIIGLVAFFLALVVGGIALIIGDEL